MSDPLRPIARLLVESVYGHTGPLPEALGDVSVSYLTAAGQFHRLRPALRRRLRSSDAPEQLLMPLEMARHAQLMRQMRAGHDLALIVAAFGTQVRWATAKGPVLTDVVWPHPDMREYTDVDVFVHPSDFASALTRLEAAGFTYVDRNWPEIMRLGRAELAMQGPSGFPLDLHWDINVSRRARRAFKSNLPAMLGRLRQVRTGTGVPVPTFDATDSLIHLAHHAAQSGANRLVWIGDVLHASRSQDVDWSALSRRTLEAGMTTTVGIVLARAERTFSVTLPLPQALRRQADRSISGRIASTRDARFPFPALPGDPRMSGAEYSSARRDSLRSLAAAIKQWVEVRVTESRVRRRGPDTNPLDIDVSDSAARTAYLNMVASSADRGDSR